PFQCLIGQSNIDTAALSTFRMVARRSAALAEAVSPASREASACRIRSAWWYLPRSFPMYMASSSSTDGVTIRPAASRSRCPRSPSPSVARQPHTVMAVTPPVLPLGALPRVPGLWDDSRRAESVRPPPSGRLAQNVPRPSLAPSRWDAGLRRHLGIHQDDG